MARTGTGEHITIRHFQKTDYRVVSRIYSGTIREYLASLRKAGKDKELVRERRSIMLTLPLGEFEYYSEVGCSFVALSREKVVGFVLAQPIRWLIEIPSSNHTLWLEYIAVTRAFRNQGVGSALLSSVKRWGVRQGIGCMFTTLNPNNEESRGLLCRAGFEVREWLTASYPPS
jgi:GNAT superfamily N-acetyltransferase